jgi:hypothetical protein
MTVKPISPSDTLSSVEKVQQVPEVVFEVINELIRREFRGEKHLVIKVSDICDALTKKGVKNPTDIINKNYSGITTGYSLAGWPYVRARNYSLEDKRIEDIVFVSQSVSEEEEKFVAWYL